MSFLSAIAVISLAVMFPVLLSLRKTGVRGTGSFCLACVLSALSAGISLTSEIAPPWFHTVIGATLMIAAGLAALNGFREFLGRKPLGLRWLAGTLAGTVMVLCAFSYGFDSTVAPATASAGLSGLVYALTGLTIMRHWSRERAIAPYMLFCCMSAFAVAALHATRVIALTTDLGSAAEPQIWTATFAIARQLIMPLFFLGIILMLHGWMIANLRHMIAHDELTGALSRRAFMAEYEQLFNTAALSGGQMAFMLLDLDRFKQINDLHGHAGGDAALAHFTRIVDQTLAGQGLLGRLGGEEFGVVVTDLGRLEAAALAEAICAAVRSTPVNSAKGVKIALTVSIGVAIAEPGSLPSEVMVQADIALYEAKEKGRNRVGVSGAPYAGSDASARALAGAAAQMRAAAAGSTTPPQSLSKGG